MFFSASIWEIAFDETKLLRKRENSRHQGGISRCRATTVTLVTNIPAVKIFLKIFTCLAMAQIAEALLRMLGIPGALLVTI